ncbi:ABC transporter permease [Streptomyces sp. NPDC007863]|uniref:ABC transporter permease n=1 Tax=Streptomyces sp. NPDC007863 TaxID=3154894 RepID=UPI0033D5CAD4
MARAVALLTAGISLLLAAFAWPSVRSSVHDVPIAVAGPAPAVEQFTAVLGQRLPGGFEVTEVADTAAAERLIRHREVYGAIDLGSGTPQVITASGASIAVAQTLNGIATGLGRAPSAGTTEADTTEAGTAGAGTTGAATSGAGPTEAGAAGAGTTPTVRDLVPLPVDDPRGAGLAAGALPLVMGGLLAALLLTRLVRGRTRRVAGALAFAVTGGLATATILHLWFGSLDGSFWANGGAIALTLAATSLSILGLASLLGSVGFGLGAAVMMLVGNPLSGTATAPEMLPGWSGALGQLLPPGAGGRLLRSTAFFDGHGATGPVVVLAAWLALGVVLCLAGGLRARTAAALAGPPAPATA